MELTLGPALSLAKKRHAWSSAHPGQNHRYGCCSAPGRGQGAGIKRSRFTEENRPCVAIGWGSLTCDRRLWTAWREELLHKEKNENTPATYRRWTDAG